MGATLPVLEVELGEGVLAAFTTRGSGNLGLNVADDAAAVVARRRDLEGWAGGPIAFATQVHGTAVAVVAQLGGPEPGRTSVGEYDALVSTGGVALGVLVADCVPVLLADHRAGVVATVHAGRAGLAAGVVQAAVACMAANGADPAHLRAAIGPAICGKCYEVPAALRAEVAAAVPETWATTSWGTPALDLPAGVGAILAAVGVRSIQRLDACTRTDERFYSHRRFMATGFAPGRFAGIICSRRASHPAAPPGVSARQTAARPC